MCGLPVPCPVQDPRQSDWLQMVFSADSTRLLTIASGAEPLLEVWDVAGQRVEARVPLPLELTTLPASFFPLQRDVMVVAGEQVRWDMVGLERGGDGTQRGGGADDVMCGFEDEEGWAYGCVGHTPVVALTIWHAA